ncbi:uncharacterized protein LOC111640603 isoform X1 [Centruroides sculpturatus]|uniref:uncharacterized protein LOC111640603 isoform X1 n=1 Tax=Centruroides sculpturatus TaxID=218467 RepID=UPI000C6CBF53|nr:uncharacterized protein LOC111640603 isoform X1 [Centruroides sculpturatus]
MAHGKKDGFSYIDGIPIKVIEKYRPPRKVMLPIACHIPDLTPLLKEEYDFSLENKVLKWTENYRQEIKEVEDAKRKNMASETEFTKPDILSELKLPDSEERVMQSDSCEKQTDSDIPVNANFVPKWQIHSILEPQQVPCQSVSNGLENVRLKNINISDFESESTSPFDYVELQTINDLEELNSVFQDMNVVKHSTNNALEQNNPSNVSLDVGICHTNWEFQNRFQFGNDRTVMKRTLSQPIFESAVRHQNHSANQFVATSVTSNPCLKQNTLENSCKMYSASLGNPPTEGSALFNNTYNFSDKDSNCSPYSSLSASVIRNSRSISDLRKITDLNAEEDHTSWRPNTPPLKSSKSVSVDKEHFSLPDLFDELTTEGKNLVSSIQEMGFPRGQVARAVKHMGMDSKKVIEHLCQIQQLVEMGHNDSDAEIALHFNEYSIEEAKKFLDLMNQLIGLGFKKNAVIKALVQHGSDQDKVLDALLS